MRKLLLTVIVIMLSSASAIAASATGRVKITVVRTNVQPADVNIVKSSSNNVVSTSPTTSTTFEIIY